MAAITTQGIPTLVTLDENLNVVNKNARGKAASDPMGETFPWPPEPLEELSTGVECNGFDVNEKAALVVFCDGASQEVKDAAKAAALEVATEAAAAGKGREEGPDFICFTATSGEGPVGQVKRLCGLPGDPISQPLFLYLDIPDNGGFYTTVPEAVSAESIRAFLASKGDRQQLGK